MAQFEEPEVLATFDRSWKDKHERLQLERGEFNGRPTFTLRICWQADDGSWRWSPVKPNANGKCWQSMSIKGRELRELGLALIKASEEPGSAPVQPRQHTKDNPRRAAERERFDRQNALLRPSGGEDTDNLPF